MSQQISRRRGLRRPALLLATTVLALGLFAGSAAADNPPPIPANANWLTAVNFYRAMAGLGTVSENTSWSDGDWKHARYVSEQRWGSHYEDPCYPPQYFAPPFPDCASTGRSPNPFYTPEGDLAGQKGNVVYFWQTPGPITCVDRTLIEFWIAGPFHLTAIIDPTLQTTGWGEWLSQTYNPGETCAATLDVLRGQTGAPAGPIKFPGHGMTTPVLNYKGGEFPDPLQGCGFGATFQNPSGPAIVLMLTDTPPSVATATLKDNGTTVNSCVRDEYSRGELEVRHVIYVMPQFPLVSGHTYDVDIAVGATHYTWTFFACAAGLTGGSCNNPTAVRVRHATAVRTRAGVLLRWRTASEDQTLGFNVYRQRNGRSIKLNRTLIPSVFGGAPIGHAYSWLDRNAPKAARSLTYRLQSVSLDGTRRSVGTATLGS